MVAMIANKTAVFKKNKFCSLWTHIVTIKRNLQFLQKKKNLFEFNENKDKLSNKIF